MIDIQSNPDGSIQSILFTSAFLLVLLMLSACNIGGSETDEELATIDAVNYTNKIFEPGRIDDISEITHALDVSITFTGSVQHEDIKRILIFADGAYEGLGWEIQSHENMDIVDDVLHLRNLLVNRQSSGDSLFDLTLYWENGETSEYQFIRKDVYSRLNIPGAEWYDQNNLRLNFSTNSSVPDSGRMHWLNDGVEVGNTSFSQQEITDNIISISEIPNTANAFYATFYDNIQEINTEFHARNIILPERIPPNLVFIDGADLPQGMNLSRVSSYEDNFIILTGNESWQGTENPTLYIIDAGNQMLRDSYEIDGRVTTFAVDEGFMYIGYESGQIEEISLDTDNRRTLTTLDSFAEGMIRIGDWLLASVEIGHDEQVTSIDVTNGEVVHSSYFRGYTPHHFTYSPTFNKGFSDKGSIGPQDIMVFDFDESTGEISNVTDSRYHGDFPIQGPFFMTQNESMVITAEGTIFTAGMSADLEYAGRFKNSTQSLQFHPSIDRAYAIRGNGSMIDVYSKENHEHLRSVSAYGSAYHIIYDNNQLALLTVTGNVSTRLAVTILSTDELEPVESKTVSIIKPKVISQDDI